MFVGKCFILVAFICVIFPHGILSSPDEESSDEPNVQEDKAQKTFHANSSRLDKPVDDVDVGIENGENPTVWERLSGLLGLNGEALHGNLRRLRSNVESATNDLSWDNVLDYINSLANQSRAEDQPNTDANLIQQAQSFLANLQDQLGALLNSDQGSNFMNQAQKFIAELRNRSSDSTDSPNLLEQAAKLIEDLRNPQENEALISRVQKLIGDLRSLLGVAGENPSFMDTVRQVIRRILNRNENENLMGRVKQLLYGLHNQFTGQTDNGLLRQVQNLLVELLNRNSGRENEDLLSRIQRLVSEALNPQIKPTEALEDSNIWNRIGKLFGIV